MRPNFHLSLATETAAQLGKQLRFRPYAIFEAPLTPARHLRHTAAQWEFATKMESIQSCILDAVKAQQENNFIGTTCLKTWHEKLWRMHQKGENQSGSKMLGGQELLSSIHLHCENFLAKQKMHDCYNAAWTGLEKGNTAKDTLRHIEVAQYAMISLWFWNGRIKYGMLALTFCFVLSPAALGGKEGKASLRCKWCRRSAVSSWYCTCETLVSRKCKGQIHNMDVWMCPITRGHSNWPFPIFWRS